MFLVYVVHLHAFNSSNASVKMAYVVFVRKAFKLFHGAEVDIMDPQPFYITLFL